MLLIDFTKLSPRCLNTTMADMGMTDFNNLPFPTILKRLGLDSEALNNEYFPVFRCSDDINLTDCIQKLRQQKKIADVIGPTRISQGTPICFSTFLGLKPKEYIKQYLDVAKILCETANGVKFVAWLEDTLSILKNGWDASMTQQAITAYQTFFGKEFPGARVMISSQIAPRGIPQDFIEKLSRINTEEFLSLLPFHLRNPLFIKVMDIVHFVWNCYFLYRLPGIHLAGINNKRHFQLFRKVIGQQVTTVLLPLGSESTLV